MFRQIVILIAVMVATLIFGCGSSRADAQPARSFATDIATDFPAEHLLPNSVVNALQAANIPDNAIGVVVTRLADGVTVVSHNADASLAPASTMKLVTTFIGLERLGPIHRGRTDLLTLATPMSGALKGDLVLRGLGDADLDWQAFQNMLQTLRNKGIQDIQGNLVVDRQLFKPSRLDINVPPFDEAPEFRYNVIPDALMINMNLLQFALESDGSSLRIATTPSLDRVTVVSNMKLVDGPCSKWEDGWLLPTLTPPLSAVDSQLNGSIQIQLQGTFPKNCAITTDINILDRAAYTDRLFRSLWAKLGGTYQGVTRETAVAVNAGEQLLATHRSRPLAEVLRDINKPSDNTLARMLYLTLGTLPPEPGQRQRNDSGKGDETTLTASAQEVYAWFERHGISRAGLVMENGSGLSRLERIRPSQLAGILIGASQSAWAPEFLASLPIVGIDGTMRNRLRDTPAAGWARIKTGTLKNVVAIAGYVPDAKGQMCAVVAIVNHPLASGALARPIMDAMIDWVVRTDTRRERAREVAGDWFIEQMKM